METLVVFEVLAKTALFGLVLGLLFWWAFSGFPIYTVTIDRRGRH